MFSLKKFYSIIFKLTIKNLYLVKLFIINLNYINYIEFIKKFNLLYCKP